MNNSSVSRSNHSTRVLVSICFVILLCVVIALWFSKVNAANIVRRTVSMYLDEKQISYTSVHVNNQTLSVELQSSGEGRCTLDDVKAIQNIYTVIHAQSLADKIRNVKIEIVDRTGTVIYDETEADVSSKVENEFSSNDYCGYRDHCRQRHFTRGPQCFGGYFLLDSKCQHFRCRRNYGKMSEFNAYIKQCR